ncbi:MAG TPA: metallophosphoesterase family protein [Candidatus Thermoplasmatota archaeon]|nr:metallophosphoesterase family protein [Candidatus Thermoplasmatota archaeon]
MRLALLAGVHANLPAFEAVLAALRRETLDETFDLGNLVGFGPHPTECAGLSGKRRLEGLLGSFEAAAFGEARVPRDAFPLAADRAAFEAVVERLRATLPAADQRRLGARPPTRRLVADGRRVVLAHGSSASPFERVPLDSDDTLLARHLDAARADVLVLGHAPRVATRRVGERLVVWCGSVGRARDPRGRRVAEAAWCILDTAGPSVEPRATAFDLASVERDTLKSATPDSSL